MEADIVLLPALLQALEAVNFQLVENNNIQRALILLIMRIVERRNRARGRYCILNRQQSMIRAIFAEDWKILKHIRVTRASFNNLLDLISTPQHHGWDAKVSLVVFLYWLACGASYRVVASVFAIPKTSVHDMVHRNLDKILQVMPHVIKLPTEEDLRQIGLNFAALSRSVEFNNVVGAIDGCHVEVMARGPYKNDYFNRKLRHTVHFQAICDAKGKFIHVFGGYPGSVHDSRVLRLSPILKGLYPPARWALLGDSGYPCLSQPITLLTPFREPLNGPVEERYNAHHKRGRNIIERAFGMLKTRWRSIFMQRVTLGLDKVGKVIAACCTMHNICMSNDDIVAAALNHERRVVAHGIEANGFHVREEIARRMSRAVNRPDHLIDHDYMALP